MAPTSLLLPPSSFIPLFPFTRRTLTLTLNLISYKNKLSPICCLSSNPSATFTDPEGTGAAAPTRGDLFLDRHNSKSASKIVLGEEKKRKKKKKEKRTEKVSTSVASCYGCGAPLQTVELDAPGYVDVDTYELVRLSLAV